MAGAGGAGASRETSLRSRGSPSVQTPVPGPQLPLPWSRGASPHSSPSSASTDCEAQRLGPHVKMKMVLIPTLRAPGPRPPKAGANHCDVSTSLCDMGGCSHTWHCPAPFLHLRCLPSLSACRTPTQPARPRPECPSPPPAPPSLLWLPGHPRLPATTRPLCCDLLPSVPSWRLSHLSRARPTGRAARVHSFSEDVMCGAPCGRRCAGAGHREPGSRWQRVSPCLPRDLAGRRGRGGLHVTWPDSGSEAKY